MSFRIFLTIFHDLIIFIFSFFLALWLRVELQLSLELFSSLWVYSIGFSIMNIIILNFLGLYHGIWRYASIHEINSMEILQPGPAALTDGLARVHDIISRFKGGR